MSHIKEHYHELITHPAYYTIMATVGALSVEGIKEHLDALNQQDELTDNARVIKLALEAELNARQS